MLTDHQVFDALKNEKTRNRRITAGAWSNAARFFFALWYLVGSPLHVVYGITDNHIYAMFGRTSIFPFFREPWTAVVMPHIIFFALLLAVFEMTTGILLLGKGKYAVAGLAASVLFNLFLVQLGLGYQEVPWSAKDILLNRTSTSLFALLQCPLFWVRFDQSLPEFLRLRWHREIKGGT